MPTAKPAAFAYVMRDLDTDFYVAMFDHGIKARIDYLSFDLLLAGMEL